MVRNKIEYEISQLVEDERTLYFNLRGIMDEWDPLYLLANGAPPDEYHCEAWKLLGIVKSEIGTSGLEGYFSKFFDENLNGSDRDTFIKKSKEISKFIMELLDTRSTRDKMNK